LSKKARSAGVRLAREPEPYSRGGNPLMLLTSG
jgi:hypothetical protein